MNDLVAASTPAIRFFTLMHGASPAA